MKPVLYQPQHIENLKALVLRAAGIDVVLPADCYALSLKIAGNTGKQVSETTLKRIFGFTTNSNYRPSRYTLNVLSEYAGFSDWAAVCRHTDLNIVGSRHNPTWADVRTAATRISLHNVQGNRYQCGIPYEFTICRPRVDQYLRQFIASDRTVCMVDGDTGAGKTIAMTRWVERRINESVQDIVLFANSHAVLQHLLLGYDGNRWLAHVLELVSPDLVSRFMSNHAQAAPGKFFLVIDEARFRFERQPPNHTVFSEMVNMVAHFSQYPWFRFVLVMRSTTLDLYRRHYAGLMAKPQWFTAHTVDWGGSKGRVIQPFTDEELRELLANIQGAPKVPAGALPAELDALRVPRLFQYYYEMTAGRPDPFDADRSILFGIYHRYIERLISSISLGADTQLLLDGLVQLTKPTARGYCIPKKDAVHLIRGNRTCYRALLNSGLIEEISMESDILERFFLCFQSDMVLSYFLAQKLIEDGEAVAAATPATHDAAIQDLTTRWIAHFKARMR